jgi:hypothetical protein
MSMTAQGAGIPAYDSTVAEEPRRPGSVRRYASIGRCVAKATFYTFAIVFVTGIFVGLLMGMTNAHADDGGSGGDGGSSSSGTSSSSGGDGGSSSSGDGGSSSSDGGDGGSSDGGVSGASAGTGDSSSSTDGGDSSESSAAPGDSSSANGDTASSANEGSPSAQGEDSSAADTQSVATSPDATSDDSSAEASSDTPSTKVNGEATSVDGISVSNVSVDSPDPSGATLGSPAAAEAVSAQQGEATADAQATETAAEPTVEQAADPSADAVAAAAVPGTVVDNAVTAEAATAPPDTAVAADPATDDVAAAAVPGVSIATPEETAAVADAQALAKAAMAPMDTSIAADPDGTLTPGDPATDVAAAAAAVPGVTVTDPTEVGHKVTVGADFALGLGMGLAFTYQDHPYALGMKVRSWLGFGAQAYGLVTSAIEPGPETVTYFVQGQVGVPETPVVAGVEADYMPNKPPDDQVAIAPYLGVQYPFQNKPWGNVWGVEQTPRNVKTGEQGDATKSVGYGWGGMVGVAAGASELGADPASIGFVSPPANISMHMMH